MGRVDGLWDCRQQGQRTDASRSVVALAGAFFIRVEGDAQLLCELLDVAAAHDANDSDFQTPFGGGLICLHYPYESRRTRHNRIERARQRCDRLNLC